LAAAAAALLAVAIVAADGRTVLQPGWNMFSPQQDVEVGQQVSADAERQLSMLGNARVDRYVNELGRRLASKAPGEAYPYAFKVVNDRSINAFALPGGPVYINRGVIEAAINESQLAGVMAHETAHVALRHGTNQASKAAAAQVPLAILGGMIGSDSTRGVLAQLGASFAMNSVLLKYSRTAETQADILGTQILYDAGHDPRAMAEFFEIIEDQQEGGGPVEFFSNHPSPDNRIERVDQEVRALGGVPRNRSTNSREFDEITRYLASLPAPTRERRQTVAPGDRPALVILSARYGARDRFIDVRERLQSRVQDDRLDLEVTAKPSVWMASRRGPRISRTIRPPVAARPTGWSRWSVLMACSSSCLPPRSATFSATRASSTRCCARSGSRDRFSTPMAWDSKEGTP
jgi:predicted Zn-dependent protease